MYVKYIRSIYFESVLILLSLSCQYQSPRNQDRQKYTLNTKLFLEKLKQWKLALSVCFCNFWMNVPFRANCIKDNVASFVNQPFCLHLQLVAKKTTASHPLQIYSKIVLKNFNSGFLFANQPFCLLLQFVSSRENCEKDNNVASFVDLQQDIFEEL